jgi:hypothetical protein
MDAGRKFSGLKTDLKLPEAFKYAERQEGKRQRVAEKIKELKLGFTTEHIANLAGAIVRIQYAHPKCFTGGAVTRNFERLGHHPFDTEQSFRRFPSFATASKEEREICRKAVPKVKLLFDKNGEVTEKEPEREKQDGVVG